MESSVNEIHPDDVVPDLPTLSPEQAHADAQEYEERTGALPTSMQSAEVADDDDAEDFFGAPSDDLEPGELDPDPEDLGADPQDASGPENGAGALPFVEPEKPRGQIERVYRVFERITLTEQVLRRLLADIESGTPAVRVAFCEIHQATARNDKAAIAEAYSLHKGSLPARADLAAVSSRAFKERRVKEEVPTQRRLSIT
jgi:hypothetical protein